MRQLVYFVVFHNLSPHCRRVLGPIFFIRLSNYNLNILSNANHSIKNSTTGGKKNGFFRPLFFFIWFFSFTLLEGDAMVPVGRSIMDAYPISVSTTIDCGAEILDQMRNFTIRITYAHNLLVFNYARPSSSSEIWSHFDSKKCFKNHAYMVSRVPRSCMTRHNKPLKETNTLAVCCQHVIINIHKC